MDVAEFASIGAKIVEVGEKLKELRGQRDDVNAQISTLEKELTPLLTRHAQLIAEVIGVPATAVLPVPTPGNGPPPGPNAPSGSPNAEALRLVKKRVLEFLDDAEPGLSAAEVATALRLDPTQVRQVMADLSRGR